MRSAIDMVPRKLPGGDFSHTGAWAALRANQFKHVGKQVDLLNVRSGNDVTHVWDGYDEVILYHTLDFDPEHSYLLNIFDGPQEHVAKYFERIMWDSHSHIRFVSLDYPMPNYGYRCKWKRDRADVQSKMSDYWKNVDWQKLQDKCDTITDWVLDPGVELTRPYQGRVKADWIKQCEGIKHKHSHLVIGDSHSGSVYTPGSIMLRKDGRSLQGIIKKGVLKEISDFGYDPKQLKSLTCYWGNIDIRHHLCRASDPRQATLDLVNSYVAELVNVQQVAGYEIEVVSMLPIEDESRKLPLTGYYQGTPFFGTRKQRQEVLQVFNDALASAAVDRGWKLFTWPEEWYRLDGIEFIETVMERPRSVHIAKKFYRWDLDADVPNSRLVPKATAALFEFD